MILFSNFLKLRESEVFVEAVKSEFRKDLSLFTIFSCWKILLSFFKRWNASKYHLMQDSFFKRKQLQATIFDTICGKHTCSQFCGKHTYVGVCVCVSDTFWVLIFQVYMLQKYVKHLRSNCKIVLCNKFMHKHILICHWCLQLYLCLQFLQLK